MAAVRRGPCPFLYEHVGVDAAEAESAHCGAAWSGRITGLPRLRLGEHPERAGFEVQTRSGLDEVGCWREGPRFHGQKNLDEPRGAGAGKQMSYVGLHTSDNAVT